MRSFFTNLRRSFDEKTGTMPSSDVPDTSPTETSSADTPLPSDHPPTESARVIAAWKKTFQASQKWPWELLPEQYRPPYWSQGLAEKFTQVVVTTEALDNVALEDAVEYLVDQIKKHTRKDQVGLFIPNDCDLTKVWLESQRRSRSRFTREATAESSASGQESSDRRNPTPFMLTKNASSTQTRKRPGETLTSPRTQRGTEIDDDLSDRDLGTLPAEQRRRSLSALLGTPSQKATPTKIMCTWLNERINHAATDLEDAREKQSTCAEELAGQNTKKGSLATEKATAEKEVEDAKQDLGKVIQRHTTNTNIVKSLSDLEAKEGDNCPKDVLAMLANYRAQIDGQEAAENSAKAALETKQARVQRLDNDMSGIDAAIEKLTQQQQEHAMSIALKEREEEEYKCILDINKLGQAGMHEVGDHLAGLRDWIDEAQALLSRRDSV